MYIVPEMLRGGGSRMSFWHGTKLISFDLWTKAFGIGLSTKSSCWWFHQFLHQFDIYIKENPSRNRHNDSSMSTGFSDFFHKIEKLRWGRGCLLTTLAKKQCGVLPNCWFKLRSAILVILLCGFKNAWKMSKLIHCMFLFGLKAPTSVCFVYHFPWVAFHLYLKGF